MTPEERKKAIREALAEHLAQSIYAALFAISNEGDIEKAEEILDRANDFAEENGLI